MSERITELEAFVSRVAALAPEQHWSDDAFADAPPEWARYEDYGMHGDQCGRCGAWCSVVRPGKTQCNVCCDDDMIALAIEAKRLSTATTPANERGEWMSQPIKNGRVSFRARRFRKSDRMIAHHSGCGDPLGMKAAASRIAKLDALLIGRDEFIVAEGLWSKFVDTLSRQK